VRGIKNFTLKLKRDFSKCSKKLLSRRRENYFENIQWNDTKRLVKPFEKAVK